MEYNTFLAEQAYVLAKQWSDSRSVADVSQLSFKETDIEELSSNQTSKNL